MTLPNGPKSWGILQMLHWIVRPFHFMEASTQEYGDCFTVKLGENFAPVVFMSHPQALKTLLTSDDGKVFEAPGELNGLFEPLLGNQSVIGLSGDRHGRMRQLMMPPFHGERMRSYGQLISDITDEVMRSWQKDIPFLIRPAMQTISMRVILRTVFGLEDGPRYQKLETLLAHMLDQMSNPFSVSLLYFPKLRQDLGGWSPWGRFLQQMQQIDALIYEEIEERKTQALEDRDDILALLMLARDENGDALTDKELRDELMTLLVAGHETTATALSWALYWLCSDARVYKNLLEELARLEDPIDPGTLFRLSYLNAVCSETLRIYPVALLTFPRIVKSSVDMMGHCLQPGTVVIGSIYLAHHREDIYPDADRFYPERFLEQQYSPFEFLPFGGGARRCIGMAFAQFEMKVVLSRLMSQIELELVDTIHSVKPVRRGLVSSIPSIKMKVKDRNPE
jgi:cytochrome P450